MITPLASILTPLGARRPTSTTAPAFDPSDYGTVGMWYKADAITGLSDGDPVANWEDSGPNSYDATQGSTSLQPTYRTSRINSLPAVRFVSDDWLGMDQASAPTGNSTTFIVARINTLSSGQPILARARITNGWHVRLESGAVKSYINVTGNVTVIASTTTGPGTGTARLITTEYDGSSNDAWLDSGSHGSAAQSGAMSYSTADGVSISGYRQEGGDSAVTLEDTDICEILVYHDALDSTERAAVETYLKSKWGIS